MREVLGGITFKCGARAIETETTAIPAGPHVLVLATAAPDLGVTVTTTYSGADDTDSIAVDLALAPRPIATHDIRRLARDELPVTHARDRCLLDHLAQVRAALADLAAIDATVDIGDAALHRAATS